MESDAIQLVIVFVAGLLLGALYFGALWLTVSAMQHARNPHALFLLSFVGRTALLLTGFWLVMAERWERAAVCLVGFVVARLIVTNGTKISTATTLRETR